MDVTGELLDIMKRLRAPDGCPWDREQSHETLKPYLIEEAYELIDAIDEGDLDAMKDELGDVLLQVVFHAQIAEEAGKFDYADVVRNVCDKLIRRHPHVFDTATVVSITINEVPATVATDHDLALEMADRLNEVTLVLMERYGVERVQRSSGSQLYLTGLNQDSAQVSDAADFALAAMRAVTDVAAEFGQEETARAGMSSGDVATGVLGTNQLSFGVWGDPTGKAMTLASLALPGQVLADGSVIEQLDRDWDIDVLDQLPGLADDIRAHVVNGRV